MRLFSTRRLSSGNLADAHILSNQVWPKSKRRPDLFAYDQSTDVF
jgi:hypothetical protein